MCKYRQRAFILINGHIIGFRPQTKKLESPQKTPSSIVAVKGLTEISKLIKFEGNTFKLSEGIPQQSRAAVTDFCKISKICKAISSLVFNKSLFTSALLQVF